MTPFQTKTIDLGEKGKLLVEELPPEIQGLVQVHDEWKTHLRDAQLELTKVQYAVERVSAEISKKVEEMLNPPEEEGSDADADQSSEAE